MNEAIDNPADAGEYTAKISPVGIKETLENTAYIEFEINKIDPKYTKPQAIAGLKYNEKEQKLIKAGSCEGGTMVYSLSDDEDGSYSEEIPTAKEVGIYDVYVKICGDKNHNDVTLDPISVEIKKVDSKPNDVKTIVQNIVDTVKTTVVTIVSTIKSAIKKIFSFF